MKLTNCEPKTKDAMKNCNTIIEIVWFHTHDSGHFSDTDESLLAVCAIVVAMCILW